MPVSTVQPNDPPEDDPVPSTDVDLIRLLIGDTDAADELLTDGEIQALADARTLETDDGDVVNLPAAAADACNAIAAKFARDYTFGEDGQTFDRAQRVNHYRTLAEALRRRQGGQSVPLLHGGTLPVV